MPYVLTYIASLAAFLILDGGWLTLVGPKLYKPVLGPLLADKVDLLPAVLFYLIYIAGMTALVTLPAAKSGGLSKAALTGAIFGFVAYATYDLTNAATLKTWAWKLTIADMAWGSIASAAAATVGCLVLQKLNR